MRGSDVNEQGEDRLDVFFDMQAPLAGRGITQAEQELLELAVKVVTGGLLVWFSFQELTSEIKTYRTTRKVGTDV